MSKHKQNLFSYRNNRSRLRIAVFFPLGVWEKDFIYSYHRAVFPPLFTAVCFNFCNIKADLSCSACMSSFKGHEIYNSKSYVFKRLFVLLTCTVATFVGSLCQFYLFDNQCIITPREHHVTIKQGLLWVIYKSTEYEGIYWNKSTMSTKNQCMEQLLFVRRW